MTINRIQHAIDLHTTWMDKDGDDEDERHDYIDASLHLLGEMHAPMLALAVKHRELKDYAARQFANGQLGTPRDGWASYDETCADLREAIADNVERLLDVTFVEAGR